MFELILNMPLVTSYYQKWFNFRNIIFFEDSYKAEYKDNV